MLSIEYGFHDRHRSLHQQGNDTDLPVCRLRRCCTRDQRLFGLVDPSSMPDKPTLNTQPPVADRLLAARTAFRARDYDAAAKTIQAFLLEQPDNRDAILIAAQIEAARDHPTLAIELCSRSPSTILDLASGQRNCATSRP